MAVTITRREFGIATAAAAVSASAAIPSPAAAQGITSVAIAGLAHPHLPTFVAAIDKRAGLKIAAVWDEDPALSQKWAMQTGARAAKSPEEIWKDQQISAAVICSPTAKHADLAIAAASAGKHLYVEKPLGVGSKDADAMADAIEKAGVIFQSGYVFRSEAVHLFLRQQIKAGAFGTITRARCCNANAGILSGQFDSGQPCAWMMDEKASGGGAFADGGTHALDLLMWLLGDVTSVSAILGAATHQFKADEFGEAVVQFKSGAIGSVAAGWVDVANPVTLQISGTQGSAAVVRHQLFFKSTTVAGADGAKPWTDLPAALAQPIDLFLDALEGKKNVPLCTAREAADRCAVMEAIYHAAANGERIKVAEELIHQGDTETRRRK
jgi:1,5-anhydro-D-fructose reductase (1,5-anhydro-D-mannitol-forming)